MGVGGKKDKGMGSTFGETPGLLIENNFEIEAKNKIMGKQKSSPRSEFRLEGRLLGFVVEDGCKIKRMKLATAEGEMTLKLTKEARASLYRQLLVLGDWVEVIGERKLDRDELKVKVDRVLPKVPTQGTEELSENKTSRSLEKPAKTQAYILVCQKSDCCKLGAKQVSRALEESLRDRGLAGEVIVKGTGCMKQCKAGPNIVMPDKTRYRRVEAEEIPELLDKHLAKPEYISKESVPELAIVS